MHGCTIQVWKEQCNWRCDDVDKVRIKKAHFRFDVVHRKKKTKNVKSFGQSVTKQIEKFEEWKNILLGLPDLRCVWADAQRQVKVAEPLQLVQPVDLDVSEVPWAECASTTVWGWQVFDRRDTFGRHVELYHVLYLPWGASMQIDRALCQHTSLVHTRVGRLAWEVRRASVAWHEKWGGNAR
jgi:hypothetical protein